MFIYNISEPNPIKNIIASISPSSMINRKIALRDLMAITVAVLDFEFTLHIRAAHDYRMYTKR